MRVGNVPLSGRLGSMLSFRVFFRFHFPPRNSIHSHTHLRREPTTTKPLLGGAHAWDEHTRLPTHTSPPPRAFTALSPYRSFPTFQENLGARRPPSPQYGRRWCVPALVRSVYDTSRPTLAHSRPVSTLNRSTDTPKSGPTSVQPHTRTTRRTRESACDTVTSDPVPRPHGGYGRGGDSYRRLQHGGMPMCAINARGGGLSMRPAAAAPVDSRHVAKSRRRTVSIQMQEMIAMVAPATEIEEQTMS